MVTDPLRWSPGSFYRRPEWRWLRAEYLLATGRRRDRRIDDAWVSHARAAIQNRGGAASRAATVRAAHEIWAGDPAVKGELEARLLTDEPLDRVAVRLALPAALVEAYAAVFFAVRPMRAATDWLLTHAVGYSPLRGFTGPQPAAAWKLAALAGGPVLLDVVIAATTGRPMPDGLLTASGQQRAYKEARIRLLAEIWVASMAAVTDEDFAGVVRDRRRLRDLDAHNDGRAATQTPKAAAVEAFLAALPETTRSARRGGATSHSRSIPPARPGRAGRAGDPGRLDHGRLDDEIDAGLVAGPDPSGDPAPHTGTDRAAREVNPGRPARDQPRRLAG
ncbi:hypothetical protein [Urbifossiella limnaea]|uniref:Uncharacterized protein n=1 Tax=Urbifossiella limnaea TaxID=2528023 RepID=A0A517XWB1_9BACT|nr:hypothetical protein [Urbifossiella limnaea]QDU21792.1 hypothetical protein ETAA1_37650 [Urbifossiella limnaea]